MRHGCNNWFPLTVKLDAKIALPDGLHPGGFPFHFALAEISTIFAIPTIALYGPYMA